MADLLFENSALIIPIYNQHELAKRICLQLPKLQEALPVSRIIFVADNCSDATDDLISRAIVGNSFFQLLPYSGEVTGQAAAVVRAASAFIEFSTYAFCDLDHLLKAQELARFLRCFSGNSDMLRGVRMSRQLPIFRRITSNIANRFATICAPSCTCPDIGSPLLVTRRESIEKGLAIYQAHGPLFFPLLYPLITERIEQETVWFHEDSPSSYSVKQLVGVAMLFIQTAIKLRGIRQKLNESLRSNSPP